MARLQALKNIPVNENHIVLIHGRKKTPLILLPQSHLSTYGSRVNGGVTYQVTFFIIEQKVLIRVISECFLLRTASGAEKQI